MNKLSRQIYRISAKAYLEAIKVYEKELPEELQSNETFDFFILCLQKTCAEDLYKWGIDALQEEKRK